MEYIDELKRLLGEKRVSTNPTVLEHHSHDESYHPPHLPDVVVFPQTAEEVSKILQLAYRLEIPVTPFGLGTSLEGHAIPYRGGISVDFSQMNRIIEVLPGDFLVRVQPGVTRTQLNKELKKYGLFFSVDPGADATLGGMAATNASGTTSVRYGIMRDQVRDLEVVLADGRIIRTGGMAAKSSSGYHLTGLFVGSEGTLGLFTELTLRVHGIPEQIVAARAGFPTVGDAVETVVEILSAGIPVARIELLDTRSIKQVNRYKGTGYRETPTLFIEFHGNEAGLTYDIDFARKIAAEHGCGEFLFETDSGARARLWDARHNAAYAFLHLSPGKKMMVTDVCLPLSELTGAIEDAERALQQSGLDGAILGHVGDGNYHVILMFDPADADERARADRLNEHLVEYALSRGGTCTGEHGVGAGKAKYQRKEHGPALDAMKAIKAALDPKGILNPGKIFIEQP